MMRFLSAPIKHVLLLFFLSLSVGNASVCLRAQTCRLFTSKDALTNTLVNALAEDSFSTIWVATDYGLFRYDGSKFITYQYEPGNPHSLQNNYVRTLYVDSKQRLLVGTRSGLQVYRYETDDFSDLALFEDNGLSGGDVSKIIERQNGEIWMSGNVTCCARIDDDYHPVLYENPFTATVDFTETIVEDAIGRIWVDRQMTELFYLDVDGQVRCFRQDGKNVHFNAFYLGPDGTLYAGGQNPGLYRLDMHANRFEPLVGVDGEGQFLVRDISRLDNEQLLVGTDNAGLKIYDTRNGTCTDYKYDDGHINPSTQKVHAVLIDKSKVMWLALYQKGLMMVPQNPQPFHYLGSLSSQYNVIGDKCVSSLLQDHEGLFWVSTDNGGLYVLDDQQQQVRYFPSSNGQGSLPSSLVCMFEDSKNRLWYGSYAQGFGWFDRRSGRSMPLTVEGRDASSVSVYDYVEDRTGRIWAVSMGTGLYLFDEERRTMVQPWNYDSCRWANCCYYDELRNRIYVGSYNGLTEIDLRDDTLSFRQYLGKFIIFALVPYTSGRMALCTSEGLIIFDLNTAFCHRYTMEDGLPSDQIYAAQCDSKGLLWISTNVGLSCFDEKLGSFTNYNVHDGLQCTEFYKNASLMDASGRLWFGGTNGVTFFNPLELNLTPDPFRTRLSDVWVGSAQVRDHRNRNFEDNSVTFEMVTVPLHRTYHAIYSYSLDNDPWNSLPEGQNRISFSHLAPGAHSFRYKALLSGLEAVGNAYDFHVPYPWYQQGWFCSLVALLCALLCWLMIVQLKRRSAIRRRLEEHVQNQALNEAQLQSFMNIAHEIRTPMTMIVSPLQKLMASEENEDRQRVYQMMKRNADRIVGTINQLMDMRKIDKNQMRIYCNQVEIAPYVNDICESMRDVADVRMIQLSQVNHLDGGLKLWVDTSNFDKILINLLSNALKYTPSGGKIEVSMEQKPASDAFPEGVFVLRVTDTGVGIPDDQKGRVFERFFQVQPSAAGKEGTGIGLHLTASLVQLHHGTIRVMDNPAGQGTSFEVSLPLGHAHLKNSEMSSEAPVPVASVHLEAARVAPDIYPVERDIVLKETQKRAMIVVAEDDAEIRRYIVQDLAAYCSVVECVNGKEALDAVMQHVPDLVLSDVMMPEMDGFELCRKLRSNIRLNHIPIILLTAKSDEESRMESLDLGADAFLTKPFNMEVLRRTIQNLLRSRASLRNAFSGLQMPSGQVSTPSSKSPDERLMERVLKVIDQQLSNPELTADMIAQEVGMSRVHLYRKLRELTNQSARTFIRNIRLAKAAELLAEKKCSVAEVAETVGFTNASNFATSFRELYGTSPSAYMEEHNHKSD